MTAYVALLRAVNVGGRNRLPMADLRAALDARGFESVSTVLQSGNVLLDSPEPERAVAESVRAIIAGAFGLDIAVIVRSRRELTAVAGKNPFEGRGDRDPTTLYVAFFDERPTAAKVAKLDPDRSADDAFVVSGREVYLDYPHGSGRSRLTLDYLERTLGTRGTARNARTVQRLASLLAER
jgi:uncharacterized protein (DUF1697 family)